MTITHADVEDAVAYLNAAADSTLCDRVVAVLGDENFYPCKLEVGHSGQCKRDYEAT